MKDFYSTLTDTKTPNTGVVRFMHIRERGKPQEEVYDFSLIGTWEEFILWAKHEFGYLKIEIFKLTLDNPNSSGNIGSIEKDS